MTATSDEFAVDVSVALNEAADTLTLLVEDEGVDGGQHFATIHDILTESARAGNEATHRLNVDGQAAVSDTVNIAYDFAMSAAGLLLDVLTDCTDKMIVGTVARAYTYYLTAAAAAVAYAYEAQQQGTRPDYRYFKFLEESWHGEDS